MITDKDVLYVIQKYNIDERIVPFDILKYALNVELEHGKKSGILNVSNDNLDITAKIALAHLNEHYLYYDYLKIMEKELEYLSNYSIYHETKKY